MVETWKRVGSMRDTGLASALIGTRGAYPREGPESKAPAEARPAANAAASTSRAETPDRKGRIAHMTLGSFVLAVNRELPHIKQR